MEGRADFGGGKQEVVDAGQGCGEAGEHRGCRAEDGRPRGSRTPGQNAPSFAAELRDRRGVVKGVEGVNVSWLDFWTKEFQPQALGVGYERRMFGWQGVAEPCLWDFGEEGNGEVAERETVQGGGLPSAEEICLRAEKGGDGVKEGGHQTVEFEPSCIFRLVEHAANRLFAR